LGRGKEEMNQRGEIDEKERRIDWEGMIDGNEYEEGGKRTWEE
jgi:hypothetical protein